MVSQTPHIIFFYNNLTVFLLHIMKFLHTRLFFTVLLFGGVNVEWGQWLRRYTTEYHTQQFSHTLSPTTNNSSFKKHTLLMLSLLHLELKLWRHQGQILLPPPKVCMGLNDHQCLSINILGVTSKIIMSNNVILWFMIVATSLRRVLYIVFFGDGLR